MLKALARQAKGCLRARAIKPAKVLTGKHVIEQPISTPKNCAGGAKSPR